MDHLARMTLGDAKLEHDILQLFEQQSAMLLARMPHESPCSTANASTRRSMLLIPR